MLKLIFEDKSLKQKAKILKITNCLLNKIITVKELINFANKGSEVEHASCIEAIEHITKTQPDFVTTEIFNFVVKGLDSDTPRVIWESSRVIGNIAHLNIYKLTKTLPGLLNATENKGTVVRWAASYAISEIVKLKTKHNEQLIPVVEAILKREVDNAIKKKYFEALRKVNK